MSPAGRLPTFANHDTEKAEHVPTDIALNNSQARRTKKDRIMGSVRTSQHMETVEMLETERPY